MDNPNLVQHQLFTLIVTIFPDEITLTGITVRTETYSTMEFILKSHAREQLILGTYLIEIPLLDTGL